MDYNKIYTTAHYGIFKIINDLGPDKKDHKRRIQIQFILTGTTKIVRYDQINHDIRDPHYPRIYGVACSGNLNMGRAEYKSIYDVWIKMISRCYNINDKDYMNYGGIGVTVAKEWLCFENYMNDLKYIPNYDLKCKFPNDYQLDKDYLQLHIPPCNRVYSKYTCIFLSKRDNTNVRSMDNSDIHGVYKNGNYFNCYMDINNHRHLIGTFINEIAAANAYNNFKSIAISKLDSIPLLNKVEYMPPSEVIKYNIKAKEMCKII